jgi:uncharacterized repeat protein (TIGR01451 family)
VTVTSNTITATVESVSSVVVGPNETGCNPKTDPVVTGQQFVRTFSITNSSNITDTYAVTAAVTSGSIVSLAYVVNGTSVPVVNGATLPSSLAEGASAQIIVTATPGSTPVGSNIEVSLTAKSTASGSVNGTATSTAEQCAIVAGAAAFGGAGGTGTVVTKLVNGASFVQAAPGSTLSYSITFSNTGGVPATNVVLTDVVPSNIVPIASTVLLNGSTPATGTVTVSGQTLTLKIPSLAPAVPQTVTFSATVSASMATGTTMVNTATLSADNAPAQATTSASAFIGVGNVVYDGLAGQNQTVSGATVTIVNATTNQPVTLTSGSGFGPNASNTNPYQTGSGGAYGFALAPNQVGPISYLLTIVAPGYINRQIKLTLTPGPNGLYTATLTAEDGQLLATPGGFGLVAGPVNLANVYGLFGNIPLFRTQSITITKTVDRSFAATGDRLVYTLTFANVGSSLAATTVVDTLPAGVFYAPGTGRVDKIPQEPVKSGRTLTWTLPSLTTQHTITYATVILPGTADYTVLTNTATVSAAAPNDPSLKLSATSTVDTRIVPGVFTDSGIITGRVFYDQRHTGFFERGDTGIPRVRIYLEDGESVLTDQFGRYSFPAVKPGMHVLKIDRSTLPPTAHPYADTSYGDERSIRRLVHGVFDGGLIQDINFALEGSPQQ